MRRMTGAPRPWTDDPILATHRFTNAYRAADRVSQYLIRHVLYEGEQQPEEIFFRALLFKFFNRIETWQELLEKVGMPAWKSFDFERTAHVMDSMLARGETIYSAAYIMPSPDFGNPRKHRNHLRLLEHMMRDGAPGRIAGAKSLQQVFEILRSYPSLGNFLAFQFTTDLNYSQLIDFSEMDFVVAGPGARDGIRKCFTNTGGLSDAEVSPAAGVAVHAAREVPPGLVEVPRLLVAHPYPYPPLFTRLSSRNSRMRAAKVSVRSGDSRERLCQCWYKRWCSDAGTRSRILTTLSSPTSTSSGFLLALMLAHPI